MTSKPHCCVLFVECAVDSGRLFTRLVLALFRVSFCCLPHSPALSSLSLAFRALIEACIALARPSDAVAALPQRCRFARACGAAEPVPTSFCADGEIMISERSRHGAPELERAGERVKHKGCALCSWPRVWVWRLSSRTHTHTDREKQRAVVSIAISNWLRIPRDSSGERLHNTHTHTREPGTIWG